jgi:hypothetical protein
MHLPSIACGDSLFQECCVKNVLAPGPVFAINALVVSKKFISIRLRFPNA